MEKTFKIYKSSAGSGKTFTLVLEFLSIALSKPNCEDYRHILAITFTNKAANEMKERVLHYLDGLRNLTLSDQAIKTIHDQLVTKLDISSESLSKRAEICLSNILHNYSQFNISTIDKFLIGVVRTFSNDLYLNSTFDVQLDTKLLFEQAVQELVSRAGKDPNLTKVLTEYVEHKSDSDENWHIENEIKEYSTHLFTEDSLPFIQRLKQIEMKDFISFKNELKAKIKTFENQLKSKSREALYIIDRYIQTDNLNGKERGVYSFLKKVQYLNYGDKDPSKTLLSQFEKGSFLSKSAEKTASAELTSEHEKVVDLFGQILHLIQHKNADYKLNKLINKSLFSLALLKEVENIIEELKEEQNFIHISEFNKKIFDLVSSEPIPFIYERYGNKFHHLMIDEFQDTSILQWQNLLPLVEHSLAQGFENLVVGDAKQAIYRWRGGDVNQFVALPEILNKEQLVDGVFKEETLKRNADELVLNNNYRSSKSIINFNNDFFSKTASYLSPEIQKIYHQHEQKVISKHNGYVEVNAITSGKKEVVYPIIFEQSLKNINDCLSRGFKFSDIAILCRTKGQGQAITNYLSDQNIPVVSNESFLLENNVYIKLIISILKYLQDSDQTYYGLKVLDYLSQINQGKSYNLFELHRHLIQGNDLKSTLSSIGYEIDFIKIDHYSLYEKVESIIKQFKLKTTDAYLIQLLEITQHFETSYLNYLRDFIKWWEEKKSKFSISIPENLNAIQVLTIHKSKGLEFPVVLLPFCFTIGNSPIGDIWINTEENLIPHSLVKHQKDLVNTDHKDKYTEELQRKQLDLVNMLYVAFTRPAEELFIYTLTFKSSTSDLLNEQAILSKYFQMNECTSDQLVFGTKEEYISKDKGLDGHQTMEFEISDWRDKIDIAFHDPELIDNDEKYHSQFERSFGIQVHYILSKMKSELELDKRLNEAIGKGMIDPDFEEKIRVEITQLFSNPLIKSFFKLGIESFNEREIIDQNGKILIPDRIIVENGNWTVIDYKTGTELVKHEKQVNKYIQALEAMGKNVKGCLIYTQNGEVKYVD